ncbi:MAG: ankyrin repeat domain-containing protein, partial [Nitrospinae bacterium]|nr:ankyrin repeat domain-containing protein [Nitrospinota bacterium]
VDARQWGWNGWTPLIRTAQTGDNEIALMLIEAGANVNMANDKKETALILASQMKHPEMAYILLKNGAKADLMDNNGRIALNYANEELKEVLKLSNGKKDFIMEARIGSVSDVKRFISSGVDINKKDKLYGMTALSWSSANGHLEVVKAIISSGANINIGDNKGNTPLMHSSKQGKEDVVNFLISRGADLNAADGLGRTACGLAFRWNYSLLVKTLEKAGGKGCPEDTQKEKEIKALIKKYIPDCQMMKSPEMDKWYLSWLEDSLGEKNVFFHYATGDFDGDGKEDIAAAVVVYRTGRKGIAIFLSSRQSPHIYWNGASGIHPGVIQFLS